MTTYFLFLYMYTYIRSFIMSCIHSSSKIHLRKKLFIHLRLFYNFGRVTCTVVFGNILHNVPLYLLCNAISIHKFQHTKASLINIFIWLVLMKSSLSKIWKLKLKQHPPDFLKTTVTKIQQLRQLIYHNLQSLFRG